MKNTMNPKQSDKKIDRIVGLIESLDYGFYSTENEEAALRCLTSSVINLEEYQTVVERDDAVRQLNKNF